MLRVGLTGGLGSGKSTAAAMFRAHGAQVLSADELGRQMMQPGQPAFVAIVKHFGSNVLTPAGMLDRAALAKLAFVDGRVAELNAIVHPLVIARQAEIAAGIGAVTPNVVLFVESALLFETEHAGAGGWKTRFDRIVLVTASDETKIRRAVDRTAASRLASVQELEADARRRLARQLSDAEKSRWAGFILHNDGSVEDLQRQVDQLWPQLQMEASAAE